MGTGAMHGSIRDERTQAGLPASERFLQEARTSDDSALCITAGRAGHAALLVDQRIEAARGT